MPKEIFPNQQQFFLGGSNPSVLPEISDETTLNQLLIDGAMVSSHGKESPQLLLEDVDVIYKSNKEGVVYLIANTFGYRLDNLGNLTRIFTLINTLRDIQIAENLNDELGITTGNALYIYNFVEGTLFQVPYVPITTGIASTDKGHIKLNAGNAPGFHIANPNSIVMVDTIFIVSDSITSEFQAGQPNNGRDWSNELLFVFNSEPGRIATLALSDRTLFVIGNNAVERWVVIGGEELLNRDNVFLLWYGLYDKKSYAAKFNRFAGLFASKDGGLRVQSFMSGQTEFQTISTPGIVSRMMKSGTVVNADIYEIDGYIYYEITFKLLQNDNTYLYHSFIYNFNNESWTETTSPFEQVVFFNNKYYGSFKNTLYTILLYENDQLKRRLTNNAFLSPTYKRYSIGEVATWFSNPKLEKGSVRMGAILDGVNEIVERPVNVDGSLYYGSATREFNVDCFQFSLIIETYLNLRWRAINIEAELYERR